MANATQNYAIGVPFQISSLQELQRSPASADYFWTGWTLTGWVDDRGNSVPLGYSAFSSPSSAAALSGSWLIDTYRIDYELSGGENHPANPASYTVQTPTIALCAASKADWDFVRWVGPDGQPVSEIPTGSVGDRAVSAVYAKRALNAQTTTLEMPDHDMVGDADSVDHVCDEINPVVRYDDGSGVRVLTNSTDYSISYAGNRVQWTGVALGETRSQTATVIVTGSGYYEGSVSASYTISYTRSSVPVCTVTLNPCGGDLEGVDPKASQTVSRRVGEKYQPLPSPVKAGNSFLGWYTEETGGSRIEADTVVATAEAHTLYARWSKLTYSITYQSTPEIRHDNPPTYDVEDSFDFQPPTFVQEGYYYTGWTPSKVDTGTTGDLTAVMSHGYTTYAISYDLGGGLNPAANPASYQLTSETITFQSPTKTGYTGSFTPASIQKGSTGNREITAVYEPVRYAITYQLDGGDNDPANPSSYTIETPDITLRSATKDGFEFVKWVDPDGNPVAAIPRGSVGAVSLSAVFGSQFVDFTYDSNYDPPQTNPPLYFESGEDGATISLTKQGVPREASFLSSATGEDGSWGAYEPGTVYSYPSVGSRLYLKRTEDANVGKLSKDDSNFYYFAMGGSIAAHGSVQWLLDPAGQSISCSDFCYFGMFSGCTSLTAAPALPATELMSNCYRSMFNGCTKLSVSEDVEGGTIILSLSAGTTEPADWNTYMFSATGGSFKGTPSVGKTYRCY